MFFLLTYLFSVPLLRATVSARGKIRWCTAIALCALVYGIAMEFVQKYFVSNRSYDNWDIVVDGMGAFAAFFVLRKRILKEFDAKK